MPRFEEWRNGRPDERNRIARENLRQNPHIAAYWFHVRFQAFKNEVLKKKWDVVDHWSRYEWQGRGSSHTHGLYWIKDAPNSEVDRLSEAERLAFANVWGIVVQAQNPEPLREGAPYEERPPMSLAPEEHRNTSCRIRPPAMSRELASTPVAERTMQQEGAYNDHNVTKKLAYADYLDRKKSLQVVHGLIFGTIDKEHYQFIQDYQPEQVREILIVLRRRFLPTPRVEMNDVKKTWSKLMRGPSKGSDVVSWLDKCELTAIRGKELGVEMFKDEYSDTPVWDLIEAIEQIDHAWEQMFAFVLKVRSLTPPRRIESRQGLGTSNHLRRASFKVRIHRQATRIE